MNEIRSTVKPDDEQLFADVSRIVDTARSAVVRTVNQQLTLMHWHVGTRIRAEILNCKRAEYGERIIPRLAERLTNQFGAADGAHASSSNWSRSPRATRIRRLCRHCRHN